MAKKEKGYYSPEAIQARQQAARYEYQKQEAAQKKAQEAQPATPTAPSTPLTVAQTGIGTGPGIKLSDSKFYIPTVKQTNPNIPNTPPYMAQDVANVKTILGTDGTEPVYYSGRPSDGWLGTIDAVIGNPFKNWVRRTWAAVNNPENFLPQPTEQQRQEIQDRVTQMKEKPYTTFHNYGENALGHPITAQQGYDAIGLDMEKVFESQATKQVAKESGKTNPDLTVAVKTAKEVAKTVAFTALQAPEWIVRQGAAVIKTVDDVADSVAGPDKDTLGQISPSAVSGVEKFKRALDENKTVNFITKYLPAVMPPLTAAKFVLDNYDFLNVVKQVTPYELFKDAGRIVVNADKIKPGQFTKTLNMNLAGSQMIYSMFQDATIRENYEKRYNDGESPLKLVLELQNPKTELMAGILYDPTTWIGAGEIKYAENGVRDTEKMIQSAAGSKIENILTENRVPTVIKDSIDQILDTNTVKTKQEILDTVQNTFKAVQEQFQVWKESRGIISLTSKGKQQVVIEASSDFLRNLAARAKEIPNGMEELVKTINSMKDLAKGEGNLEEAFSQLIKTPLGQMPLSPRGMRTASMLAEIDGEIPKFMKAVEEGDVGKLANLYSEAIEKNVKKTILSVDEMAEVAKKVKAGVDVTPEMEKIANDYKDLSPVVKFFNNANNLGKKTWMKPMGFFSEIYFGFNRFAYPTRNVLSAIPGMAYEFGWTDAVDVAIKSITGSQVEKLGVQHLESMTGEIERLIGYVPEAAMRGDTPIGEFVNTSKKYLGVIRGGGEVAQLSEQLMSAQIMLKTVRREVNNAIKSGAIPEVKELINAGLKAEDAKVLLNYAAEYKGETGKVLDAFRKYMGGEEEVFRHMPMQENLSEFLEHVGSGKVSPVKDVLDLLGNAKTPQEFADGAAAIWKKVEAVGENSRLDPVNLSDDLPKDLLDDIQKETYNQIHNVTTVSPEGLNAFERTVQAFDNAKKAMIKLEGQMKAFLYDNGVTAKEFEPAFSKLRQEAENSSRVMPLQRLVNDIRDNPNLTAQEVYKKLEESLPDFKISQFTDADPAKLTRRQMDRIMWESYYMWKGKHFAEKANSYNKGVIALFDSMAQEYSSSRGVQQTIGDIANEIDAPYKETINSFETAYKYYKQQAVDVMSMTRNHVPTGTTLEDAAIESLKQAGFSSKNHIFNSINKYRREHGLAEWNTFAQVDMWEVQDAVRRLKRDAGFIPTDPKMDMLTGEYEQLLHPPLASDKAPTPSRMIYESLSGAKNDFDNYINNVMAHWGETRAPQGALSDSVESAMSGWAQELTKRMGQVKSEAGLIASATRDAMLYDYRKQLWQVAAQYVSPFGYYHVSASEQWLKNVAADPKWGAIYIDYKEYMANRHAGLPDFWKENIAVSGLPGLDKNNPLFFNIEASVNPIYQMIGADFNDPTRRVDWLSNTMDDLGKLLPGIYQPLQWAVAANLYANNEKEAADKWLGRLIPQTKLIKTVSNALGISIPGTKYNELDPFVSLIQDGLDPSEEKRVLRFLATMPGVSEEQRIEAAHLRQGDLWDEAVRGALSNRALPEAASFFLGVGYKPRTQSDVVTDQFYQDYSKLLAARSVMPADEYKDAWDGLREKYPFMDTLLIGKRAGAERDSALAYNVLNRIPPGEMTDIAETLGIKPYILNQFYDNKGDLSKMTPADRQRFMAAVLDMSAMLKMPSGATREEWNSAKETYAAMNTELKRQYGEDILDKINNYYQQTNEADKQAYLQAYPEVEKALTDKTAYITNTPILSAYYGGIDTVSRYYNNQVYIQLEKEFGKNIQTTYEQYKLLDNNEEAAMQFYQKNNLADYYSRKSELDLQVDADLKKQFGNDIYDKIAEYNMMKYQDPAGAKAFRREYLSEYYKVEKQLNKEVKKQLESEFTNINALLAEYNTIKATSNEEAKKFYRDNNLQAYEDRKQELFDQAEKYTMQTASQIPAGKDYTIRPEFQTWRGKDAPYSGFQQDAMNYIQTDQERQTAQAIWDGLTPAAQTLVQDYFDTGSKLPSAVTNQIRIVADKYNISQYEALRLLGIEQPQ